MRHAGIKDAMTKVSGEGGGADNKSIVVAQGGIGNVTSKGSLDIFLPYLIKGIKHGLQNEGLKN